MPTTINLNNMDVLMSANLGVAAVVVVYYPDLLLLRRLLISIRNQVERIIVVDNTPTPDEHADCVFPVWFSEQGFDVTYQPLYANYGIAKAQNCGITAAIQAGCGHVILFDQDSFVSEGMVRHLMQAEMGLLAKQIKVGSVGPVFIDEKTGEFSKALRHDLLRLKKIEISTVETLPVSVDYMISSGSLIRIAALLEIGGMKEELFIDWVDVEWCLRARSLGYAHFMIPAARMYHSIGDKYVAFAKRKINLHNDVRNYYIVRNACHLIFDKRMDKRWRLLTLFKIPQYVIFYSLTSVSKQRFKAFVLLLRACVHGCMGRLGKAF